MTTSHRCPREGCVQIVVSEGRGRPRTFCSEACREAAKRQRLYAERKSWRKA